MEIEKLDLKSMDIVDEKREQLKALFPEVFTEGRKIDFERLKLTLGEMVDPGKERYGMNWPGKTDCFKIIQQPSIATLTPARDESVDFDTTENLFIEGDNLEVLKLLQKSYFGKVKMIYIDPPYNTGNDFIYPDDYSESLDTYLRYTGQIDNEGRKYSTNTEADGRFHSRWMNMMYPRLFLARNLLREDGVIFISIDDHEVNNLKKICEEIFGKENFIGQIIVKSNPRGSQSVEYLANLHEYIMVFAKEMTKAAIVGHGLNENMKNDYKYTYTDGRKYRLLGLRQRGGFWRRSERPSLFYAIFVNPDTGEISLLKDHNFNIEIYPIQPTTGEEASWRWSKEKIRDTRSRIIGKRITRDNREDWDIYQIDFLEIENGSERRTKTKSIWDEKELNYQNGTTEVKQLFNNLSIFDYPKPKFLLRKILEMVSQDEGSIILDFFAGSCTAVHTTLELNKEDGGNRKFIMVQLPEPTEENSEAHKAGFETIADIGKERIRRVINKIKDEQEKKKDLFSGDKPQPDLGFKVFKLQPSNFKLWDGDVARDEEAIKKQIELFVEHINPQSSQEDILYEILLKSGFPLTTKIEKTVLAERDVFSIADGSMLICLEKDLTPEVIKAMAEMKPVRVVCLDEGFKGNDQLKTNAVQIMKTRNITFRTV